MDKFALTTGFAGGLLLLIALAVFIHASVKAFKRKMKIRSFAISSIISLVVCILAISLLFFSLFIQTFSRYTIEELIGTVHATKSGENIKVRFTDVKRNTTHDFELSGDQWMIEGYILRWSPQMRWLGAGTYYRISRFRGRWEEPEGKTISDYLIQPEEKSWTYLLKHGEELPFVDSAYGVAAFQYPAPKLFYLYISESGFILKNH